MKNRIGASGEAIVAIDVPTLIAISIVAWVCADVLHEIVGHAGMAAAFGLRIRAVSTTTYFTDWSRIPSVGANRAIHAAGSIVNLVTGLAALAVLRYRHVHNSGARYFLWLFATISLVIVAVNHLTAPLFGSGDWTVVVQGLPHERFWRGTLLASGLLAGFAAYWIPPRFWMPNLRGHRWAQLKVTAIPVATLVAVRSLSLIRSPFAGSDVPPDQNHLLASVFAYAHFVLWAIIVNLIPWPQSTDQPDQIRLPRSHVWLIIGVVAAAVFVLVLGPGSGPLGDDPRLVGY